MIFANWQEFFHQVAQLDELFDRRLTEEELYQHFKARLLSEVVAKETITYFGDIVGKKVYELGEKE